MMSTPFSVTAPPRPGVRVHDHPLRRVVLSQGTDVFPQRLVAPQQKATRLRVCPTALAFLNVSI